MQTLKMVVTGPFNAGKTEFIQSVSEIDVVSTERKISSEIERIKETTTVAMDFGRITVDNDMQMPAILAQNRTRRLNNQAGRAPLDRGCFRNGCTR